MLANHSCVWPGAGLPEDMAEQAGFCLRVDLTVCVVGTDILQPALAARAGKLTVQLTDISSAWTPSDCFYLSLSQPARVSSPFLCNNFTGFCTASWIALFFCFLYDFSSWWQSLESVSKEKKERFCIKDLMQLCKKLIPDQIFQKGWESNSYLPPSFLISSSCCPIFY